MKNLWGKFNRIRFLEEINFSLVIIAVLMSFFAFTEGISDRVNLSIENDPVILVGEDRSETVNTDQILHIHQPTSRTIPGYWYHKGTVTGY